MITVEIIRNVIGVFFILFGLGVYAYDKLHNMKYSEFRYSPISWLITIMAGVVALSYTFERCIISTICSIVLWLAVKVIISKVISKKNMNRTI